MKMVGCCMETAATHRIPLSEENPPPIYPKTETTTYEPSDTAGKWLYIFFEKLPSAL